MPKQDQKKVILCISNDIHIDQRLHKVCTSLYDSNFNVELLGRKLPISKPLDRNYTCKRLKIVVNKGALFYAFLNIQFFFYLLFKKVDIIVANDLDTLPACHFASRIKGKKLIVDLHELFSEVPEVVARPKVQKFWIGLESYLLPKQKHVITVCQSISDYYSQLYSITLSVVRNIPVENTNIISVDKESNDKILIYQGAVNLGRGIETMIETMNFLPECYKLWIIGGGDLSEKIQQKIINNKLTSKVKLFGRLEPSELKNITPKAHLGLSLEENLGLNYYYALPNKLFDYLHAEVPMLVSPFPEMSSIINTYNVGYIRQSKTAEGLANEILDIFKNSNLYLSKIESCKQTKKKLTWENEFNTYSKVINSL